MLTKGKQAHQLSDSGLPNTTLFFFERATPPSPLHLLINSKPTAQLKELANFCAAEPHFAKRPFPEHCGLCPVPDVTLLHTSRVTEVAGKSLEAMAGGPPVSVPMIHVHPYLCHF